MRAFIEEKVVLNVISIFFLYNIENSFLFSYNIE